MHIKIYLQRLHMPSISTLEALVECGKTSFTNLYDLEYFSEKIY